MIENNSIQIKYPLDYSNKVFDGRIHTVIPLRLESFFMKNNINVHKIKLICTKYIKT